uniref:MFS domain-containing protein n=2 Tax=Trichobilharzia regenti TaxID=157069 RepID=A0AA85IYH0_TRIRE|nr:unnamed protein product [Trichobilharzia regenti]
MSSQVYKDFTVILYRRRWFALFIFCFCSFSNAYQWIHLNIISDRVLFFWGASIPGSTEDVHQIAVDWLSMIYMLTYIPLIFPSTWILDKWGLRVTMLVATALNAVGAWAKCIAGAVTYEPRPSLANQTIPWDHKLGFPILMIGQTICGIAQSGILGIPAHLAATWFGENEVSTATSFGVFGNQIGVAVGFLVPPLIVPMLPYITDTTSGNPTSILDPAVDVIQFFANMKYYTMILLYFSAALNTLPFLLVIFFFKAKPPTEPSLAQYKRSARPDKQKAKPEDKFDVFHSNGGYTKSPEANNHISLSPGQETTPTINATPAKPSNNDDTVADQLTADNFVVHISLNQHGDKVYADNSKDNPSYESLRHYGKNATILAALKRLFSNLGFVLLFLSYGIITGVYYAVGTLLNNILLEYFTDSSLFGWAGFTMIVAGIFGSILGGVILDRTKKFKLVTCAIYILSLIWMAVFTGILYLRSMPLVFVSMFFLGFFMTGYLSLGFELAAELTYPESEGLSSGLLNTSAQIFGLILIHVATTLRTHHGVLPGNLFLTALLVLGSIMTICIKENLLRQQAHERMSKLLTTEIS